MAHRVTFIPGDGTGPEIAEATSASSTPPVWSSTGTSRRPGSTSWRRLGTPLPDAVIESIKENKVAIKGPITTPVGPGFRSVNVDLRKALDLYACVRPCKSYDGVRS